MQSPLVFILAVLAVLPSIVFADQYTKNNCVGGGWAKYLDGSAEKSTSFCVQLQQDIPDNKGLWLRIGEDGRGYLSNKEQQIKIGTCSRGKQQNECYPNGFSVKLFSPTGKKLKVTPLSWFYARCLDDPYRVDFTGTKYSGNMLNILGSSKSNWVDGAQIEGPWVQDSGPMKETPVFNDDFQHGWRITFLDDDKCGSTSTTGTTPPPPPPTTTGSSTGTTTGSSTGSGSSLVKSKTCYSITANIASDPLTYNARVITGNMKRDRCAKDVCPTTAYSAVSNGNGCFCFDQSKVSKLGLVEVDSSKCDAPCSKAPSENCGGKNFDFVEFVKVDSVLSAANANTAVDEEGAQANDTTEESDSGLSGGAIAGIVIGCIAGVALVAALVVVVMKKRGSHTETF